ncbi:MAG TPA: hypothetical protein VMR50_00815 [Myxococcota bacterium]|nr:hypothetical protein [Myxococcota bacterium]
MRTSTIRNSLASSGRAIGSGSGSGWPPVFRIAVRSGTSAEPVTL